VAICRERSADLHMAQLMPLPLTVSCFTKMQIGFTFLVPAHLGSPRQRAVKRVCVYVPIIPIFRKLSTAKSARPILLRNSLFQPCFEPSASYNHLQTNEHKDLSQKHTETHTQSLQPYIHTPLLASTSSKVLEDFVGAKFYCQHAFYDGN